MMESVAVLIQRRERGGGPFSAVLCHEWFADWEAEHPGWLAPLGGCALASIARTSRMMDANTIGANTQRMGLTFFEGLSDFIPVTPTAIRSLAVAAG